MKIAIIIQARTDSERFPNKVLQKINDKPVLWHVIERCKPLDIPIIVSTTNRSIDDPIIEITKDCNVNFFRGSTNDVLDRFYQTAKSFSLDFIIRITADCPLIDSIESNKVLEILKTGNYDYVALDDTTYPDGMDTEGFSFTALKKAWDESKLSSEKEHVTPYIKNPQNNFTNFLIKSKNNYSQYRLTVDYPDDLELIQNIYSELYSKNIFHLNEIITLLEKKPNLLINSSHVRNDGYAKSLRNDP